MFLSGSDHYVRNPPKNRSVVSSLWFDLPGLNLASFSQIQSPPSPCSPVLPAPGVLSDHGNLWHLLHPWQTLPNIFRETELLIPGLASDYALILIPQNCK